LGSSESIVKPTFSGRFSFFLFLKHVLDKIVLGQEDVTASPDANQDDKIDTTDPTTLEAIIAGMG